jgi:DNA-binding CsgD family transcriptional regulator
VVDYSDPFLPRLLGRELADHLITPAAADLAAALDAVLARVEKTRAAAEIEIGPADPAGRDRRLRARIRGQWSRGKASATVVLDEPAWSDVDPAGDVARVGPPRAAVLHAERGENGRLHLEFVDDALGDLLGIPAERLLEAPASAVILARAETVLASTYPIGERTCELTIADPIWGGRPLTCRFFRGGTDGGRPSVSLLVYGPGPEEAALRREARHSDALLRLLRLSEVLLEHAPQKEGLERIVEEIVGAPGTREVTLALLDHPGQRLHVAARASRARPDAATACPFGFGEGACGSAIRERRIVVDRPSTDDCVCLYVPVAAADELLGVLAIGVDLEFEVDGWQEEIVGSYADYVAAFVVGAPARPRALHRPTRGKPDEVDIAARLTARQQDVLYLLVEAGGASNRDIARALSMTEATAKVHMRAILSGLGVGNRTEALHLVYSRAAGWLAEMRRRRRPG